MNQPVSYVIEDGIGVITIDNPPVNALSHTVRQGIQDAIRQAQDDNSQAILLCCAGRTFIAGADITEFGEPPKEPWLPELCNEIEASAKLVVAALHGTTLGGGFEVALASHYRISTESGKVGLPEVKLAGRHAWRPRVWRCGSGRPWRVPGRHRDNSRESRRRPESTSPR